MVIKVAYGNKGGGILRRPMTYIAVSFATAIWVSFYAGSFVAVLIGALLIAVLLCYKNKSAKLYIIVIFYFISLINYQIFELQDCEMQNYEGNNHVISGKVVSVERKENRNKQQFMEMKVDVNKIDSRTLKKRERILLKYYGPKSGDALIEDYSKTAPSDTLKASVVIEIPESRSNPGGFDYALYLRTLKINVIAYADKIYCVEKSKAIISKISRELFILKESYLKRLSDTAGEETSSLMRAILFGEKYELDEEVIENFRESGIAHILAVSGLHIGIIYGFLNSVWVWKKNRIFFMGVMVFFTGYMFLASFSPSVVRAVFMIGLHMAAQLTNRRYDIVSAALLVVVIMLLKNPVILFNTGLQLSFLAVLSIAMILPLIRKIYNGVYLCSLAVQMGLVPYMIYMFNCFSPVAVLVNYPVALLAGIIVPTGVCAIILSQLCNPLFGVLSIIIREIGNLLIKISSVTTVDGLTVFYLCSPHIWMLFTCYLLMFVFLSEEGRIILLRKGWKPVPGMIAFIIIISFLSSLAVSDPVKKSELLFIDVGQGDAVHLRVRNGVFGYDGLAGTGVFTHEKNYLFDGGGSDSYNIGKSVLKPYLMKNGVRKLDGAFVTHLHTDHYKGIAELCREGMVDKLYLYEANKYKINEITEETGLDKDSLIFLHQGDIVRFGNSSAEILWPESKTDNEYIKMIQDEENENDMSMIIKINHRNISALITGDIDETLMETLAKQLKRTFSLDADILKVPHHGSKYSWSEDFVDKVSPKYAVIQVGKNNYGHPAQEIVDSYLKRGIKVLRNDRQGAVGFFESSDNKIMIESMNGMQGDM